MSTTTEQQIIEDRDILFAGTFSLSDENTDQIIDSETPENEIPMGTEVMVKILGLPDHISLYIKTQPGWIAGDMHGNILKQDLDYKAQIYLIDRYSTLSEAVNNMVANVNKIMLHDPELLAKFKKDRKRERREFDKMMKYEQSQPHAEA